MIRRSTCERCGEAGRRRSFKDLIGEDPPPLSLLSREIERFRSFVPRDERGVAVPSEEALVLDRMGMEDESVRELVSSLWRHATCEAEFERAVIREANRQNSQENGKEDE